MQIYCPQVTYETYCATRLDPPRLIPHKCIQLCFLRLDQALLARKVLLCDRQRWLDKRHVIHSWEGYFARRKILLCKQMSILNIRRGKFYQRFSPSPFTRCATDLFVLTSSWCLFTSSQIALIPATTSTNARAATDPAGPNGETVRQNDKQACIHLISMMFLMFNFIYSFNLILSRIAHLKPYTTIFAGLRLMKSTTSLNCVCEVSTPCSCCLSTPRKIFRRAPVIWHAWGFRYFC